MNDIKGKISGNEHGHDNIDAYGIILKGNNRSVMQVKCRAGVWTNKII